MIAGARDRLFPLDYLRRLARERLGIDEVSLVDSGHLPALSRPEEVELDGDSFGRATAIRTWVDPKSLLVRVPAEAATTA